MKKIITLLIMAITMGFFANAQNEVILLSGETDDPEPITYYDFVEWSIDDPDKIPNWYVDFGDGTFTTWVDNPATDGINTSSKSLLAETTKVVDWWGNFINFRLDEPITITEDNRYLKIFHYRQTNNYGWSISLNANEPLQDSDLGTLRFDGDNTQDGVWEDIVIDLHYLMENDIQLDRFMKIVDRAWYGGNNDSPPTKYYWDEIVLSADPFPRGVVFLEGSDLLSFDDEEQLENVTIDTQNPENTFEVVPNPMPESMVNPDGMVGKFFKSDEASWWQGFHVSFPGLHMIEYGVKQYFHVFVKADIDCFIQLHIIDQNNVHHTEMFYYPYSEIDGEWFDLVWDLSSYTAIKAFTIRFDVQMDDEDNYINSPEGVFYIDAIVLNDDPFEREGSVNVWEPSTQENFKVYSYNNIIYFSADNVVKAQVFDILGREVISRNFIPGSEQYSLTVPQNGIYILRIMHEDGNLSSRKVMVK